jgi:hypothetical protein
MATKIITDYFRLHNVKQFRESINETANSVYYIIAGKHLPFANGDTSIESTNNTVDQVLYDSYKEMVFGKRISIEDVCPVAPRHDWEYGKVFSAYKSNIELSGKPYYVCVNASSAYHVFKCLDNNNGSPSLAAPNITQTSPDDEFYSTVEDGYVWKYMYSIDATKFNKFATANFLPVISNTQVSGNAVSGAIDVITVSYRGSNYNTYLSNTFISTDLRVGGNALRYNIANNASSANQFYTGSFLYIKSGTGQGQGAKITDYRVVGSTKTITVASPGFSTPLDITSEYEITPSVSVIGDGSGFVARALVNTNSSNSINQIEILNRGEGYTYATATVVGNTSGSTNTAILNVVLGPKGGHGFDAEYELGATALCVSSKFSNNESGAIPTENDYRTLGILKDPLYANVVLTVGSLTGSFAIGETVIQQNTNATGVVTTFDSLSTIGLTNVNGIFLSGQVVLGETSSATANVISYLINGKAKSFNTFDQRARFSFELTSGTFQNDEYVYQSDDLGEFNANAVLHSVEGSVAGNGTFVGNLYVTHVKGTINTGNTLTGCTSSAVAKLLFKYEPDLVVGSGEFLYLENRTPINRSNNQSETVKIILQF